MSCATMHQRQGATSVTVRNIITSLRLISDVDWTGPVRGGQPCRRRARSRQRFEDMDFPTRNLYRSAIEELARGSNAAELDIARRAVAAAKRCHRCGAGTADARKSDPGYHLIAGGRQAFENGSAFDPRVHKLAGAPASGRRASAVTSAPSPPSPLILLAVAACRARRHGLSARPAWRCWPLLARSPPSTRRSRWSTARSASASAPTCCRRWSCANGVPAAFAHARRRADAC